MENKEITKKYEGFIGSLQEKMRLREFIKANALVADKYLPESTDAILIWRDHDGEHQFFIYWSPVTNQFEVDNGFASYPLSMIEHALEEILPVRFF